MHAGAQNAIVSADARVPTARFPRAVLPVLGVAWLLAVCGGLAFLCRYSNTPGDLKVPPSIWPAQSSIERNPERATLLVFAHPHCPCTRATLAELERLLTHGRDRAAAFVVFMKPAASSPGWEKTDLWRRAVELPGVTPIADEGLAECERFCAQTSGVTLLYDRHGALRFHGGITSSRGHEGDNVGHDTILSVLLNDSAPLERTPVFGCCLRSLPNTKSATQTSSGESTPWSD